MLLLALLVPPALATTLTVCGGWTTDDCYPTIQEAVDAAVDGDVLYLGGGSYADYYEAVTIEDKSISILGTYGYVLWMSPGGLNEALTIDNATVDIDSVAFLGDEYRLFTIWNSTVAFHHAHFWGSTQSDAGGVGVAFYSSLTLDRVVMDGGWSYNVGGQLWVYRSDLHIDGCAFRGGFAQLGGGSIWAYNVDGDVQVTNSLFEGNSTESWGAALYLGTGGHGSTPILSGNRFVSNTGSGGAVVWGGYGDRVVEDNVFLDNAGQGGSALSITSGSATIVRNLFCANAVEDGFPDSGALTVSTSRSLLVANNEFVENANGALAIEGVVDGLVRNNHFVGNVGPEDPVIALPNGETVSAVRVAYNVVAFNLADFGATPSHSQSGFDLYDHNLWFANQPEMPAETDPAGLFADPYLDFYVADGRCSEAAGVYDRDELWMPWLSPIRDVGSDDPDDGIDLDGSPLDVGAFGGPHARATPDWDDPDEDGSPSLFDCDPVNADIFPGAGEIIYDGIDQNCDVLSDFDADEDGQDAEFFGGFDCDDTDPSVYLGAEETPYDGVDQNCDGEDLADLDGDGFPLGLDCDDTDPTINPGEVDDDAHVDRNCDGYVDPSVGLDPAGCSTAPGSPSFLLPLLALATRRRRRSVR